MIHFRMTCDLSFVGFAAGSSVEWYQVGSTYPGWLSIASCLHPASCILHHASAVCCLGLLFCCFHSCCIASVVFTGIAIVFFAGIFIVVGTAIAFVFVAGIAIVAGCCWHCHCLCFWCCVAIVAGCFWQCHCLCFG